MKRDDSRARVDHCGSDPRVIWGFVDQIGQLSQRCVGVDRHTDGGTIGPQLGANVVSDVVTAVSGSPDPND